MPVLLFHAASEVCLIRCGHCSLVCPCVRPSGYLEELLEEEIQVQEVGYPQSLHKRMHEHAHTHTHSFTVLPICITPDWGRVKLRLELTTAFIPALGYVWDKDSKLRFSSIKVCNRREKGKKARIGIEPHV